MVNTDNASHCQVNRWMGVRAAERTQKRLSQKDILVDS